MMNTLMKLPLALALIAGLGFAAPTVQADGHSVGDGLIVKDSDFGVVKTLDRLGIALERAGITVFSRIPHDKGAAKVGLTLAPTQVIIFGNPKLGTPLMQSNPAIGLDLPLKAIAWETADGKTKIAYTDPSWLAKRYSITDKDKVFAKMTGALNKFTDMATKRGMLPKQ